MQSAATYTVEQGLDGNWKSRFCRLSTGGIREVTFDISPNALAYVPRTELNFRVPGPFVTQGTPSPHETRPEIDMPVYKRLHNTTYIVIIGVSLYLYSHVYQFNWNSKI